MLLAGEVEADHDGVPSPRARREGQGEGQNAEEHRRMKRLLEAELIYGRLLDISEPHLVSRYNKALKGFGLKPTALQRFSIDMTGFSPEIAEEIGDRD